MITRLSFKLYLQAGIAGVYCMTQALAFETTKVLPKGIRSVVVRNLNTHLATRTNDSGTREPLSVNLNQSLDFRKIIRNLDPSKKNLTRGTMLTGGFNESDVVGQFFGDLQGDVRVTIPVFAYGLSDRLTLAVAAPFYQAATEISVGFEPNATGQQFINSLIEQDNLQYAAAHVVHRKLTQADQELNNKVIDNGYQPLLQEWRDSGFGDIVIAGKYLAYDSEYLKVATTGGLVLPSGRRDDPDILTDIPFGDGNTDIYGQYAIDVPLVWDLTFNQFTKYTHQFLARRTIRMVTDDEPIVGDAKEVKFKGGNQLRIGSSIQYSPSFGLTAGFGYEYFKKASDEYFTGDKDISTRIERWTAQQVLRAEYRLGYSTLPAFRRGEFAVPFKAEFVFLAHNFSKNTVTGDLFGFDISVYF